MNMRTRLVLLTTALALTAAMSGASCDDSENKTTAGQSAGGKSGANGGAGSTVGGQAGSGQAGSGQAGSGQAGIGQAGSNGGTAGNAGSNLCGGFVTDPSDPCQACVQTNCCEEAATCLAQGAVCATCDVNPYGFECRSPSAVDSLAFRKCRVASCASECKIRDARVDAAKTPPTKTINSSCGNSFNCNPVINEKCDSGTPSAGGGGSPNNGVCDETGSFDKPETLNYTCYGPPQNRDVGQTCGAGVGFCIEGLDCYDWTDTCGKYCCEDSDCSSDSRCAKDAVVLFGKGLVGICLVRDNF